MENLTKRQEKILSALIDEYIKTAEPVSSKLLAKKKGFNISPATVRNDFQTLTEMGYIHQPHISAGRAPTAKAYKFFVDEIYGHEQNLFLNTILNEFNDIENHIQNELKRVEQITKSIASETSSLVLTYLINKDLLFKEGWEDIFQNPEFKEKAFLDSFIEEVSAIEKNMKELANNEEKSKIDVYVGRENPFSKTNEFSLIIAKSRFPNNEQGIIAILGPSRMEYEKNISILQSLIKSLEDF